MPPPLNAQTILVTGATGAIGSFVVAELLKERDAQICLLLRGPSPAEANERRMNILRFLRIDPRDSLALQRVEVILGDLSSPQFGWNETLYRSLAKRITHMIHAAGNVRLNQSLEDARKDAVTPLREIVRFAQACQQNGQFEKLDYVSTIGVCGRWSGVVPEQPFLSDRKFRNTYEAAKAEAENLVLGHIKSGLPATVHRPSMVVGDSREGRIIHFQVFYFLVEFLTGARYWGLVPDVGRFHLDIIPVDYVARALVHSNQRPDAIGKIFHLCSGPSHTLPLLKMIEQLRSLLNDRGRRLPSLKRMNPLALQYLLQMMSPFLPRKARRGIKSLPFLLSYFTNDDQVFENDLTDRFFSPTGLRIPNIHSYLPQLIDFYLQNPRFA